MAWPTAPIAGQLATASLIGEIITALGSWGGSVNANGYNLTNLGVLNVASIRATNWIGVRSGVNVNQYAIGPFYNLDNIDIAHTVDGFLSHNGIISFTPSGNVGIGTTAPTAPLDVYRLGEATTETMLQTWSDGATATVNLTMGDSGGGNIARIKGGGATELRINAGASDRMTFGSDGTIRLLLGGTLKTLSVDGSGFVKAT